MVLLILAVPLSRFYPIRHFALFSSSARGKVLMVPPDGLQQKHHPKIWCSAHQCADSRNDVWHTEVTAPPHEASTKTARIPGPGAQTKHW